MTITEVKTKQQANYMVEYITKEQSVIGKGIYG